MVDPRFFQNNGPFTAGELAERTGAELIGDPALVLADVAPLEAAGPDHLSFFENRKYLEAFRTAKAGLCLISEEFVEQAPEGMSLLVSKRPRRNFAKLSRAFHPDTPPNPGIHPRAFVEEGAELGEGVFVGPGAVVETGAKIANHCQIHANAVISSNVEIGEGTIVGVGASVSHSIVGARCFIYPGARIGQPGFGFDMDGDGPFKMPQLGRVLIEDDVEVGANSTIDRGAGPDTIIGRGTMIDNLVQIGHNVQIGRGCIIVSQVGISGSTKLGNGVVAAGQVGIAGHLEIGDGVQIAAKSGIRKNLPAGSVWGGYPAVPVDEWHRQTATIRRMTGKSSKKK